MNYPLQPSHWYKANIDTLTVRDLHEHYKEMLGYGRNLVGGVGECASNNLPEIDATQLQEPGRLADEVLLRYMPTFTYPVSKHIRGAVKALLALATKDDEYRQQLHDIYIFKRSDIAIDYEVTVEELARIQEFVAQYGPLVHDFAEFCRPVRNFPKLFAFAPNDITNYGGLEYYLYMQWATYGESLRKAGLVASNITPLLWTPVKFYLWAADLLAALQQNPDWPGCRLFLANRMASLRLLPANNWGIVKKDFYIIGELLDYMALQVAFGMVPTAEGEIWNCQNPDCKAESPIFTRIDRRFQYCPACQERFAEDKCYYDEVRAKVHRLKDKGKG